MTLQSTWLGLFVYDGRVALTPGTTYSWTVSERVVVYSNGTAADAVATLATHIGQFETSASLPTPRVEAAAVMTSKNVSMLWNGSWHSVADRVQPSGFLPTSVSGGYGGITEEFVRDASGQIIGLIELGPTFYPVAKAALDFMLSQLQGLYEPGKSFNSYAPHVMTADKTLSKIVSVDARDQTDDTFYLISAWGYYVNVTGDTAMERMFYPLLVNYTRHYLDAGARSLGFGGTPDHPQRGGGVLYWNESLSLLWNPNLEHSRLGSYWSCYDQLTNSFAVEGLRALAAAADRLGDHAAKAEWEGHRAAILAGINSALTLQAPTEGGGDETTTVYAELIGHENSFNEDRGEVGYSPLLWGLSYENIVPAVFALTAIGEGATPTGNRTAAAEALGLDVTRLDATWLAIRREGSFQWVNSDPELSAFVSTTHINASGLLDPPVRPPSPSPSPSPQVGCGAKDRLKGAAALTIASGPDMCNPRAAGTPCNNVSDADACCALAMTMSCGAWFFNGNCTDCSGHGCCYPKTAGHPDKITPPNAAFEGGLGPAVDEGWCSYTGSFSSPDACPAPGGKTCACESDAVIGKMLGWELGYAAFRSDFNRLIVLHRWLGQAAHVEQTTLFGESFGYACMKNGERNGFNPPVSAKNPRGANCWGDPGNGVQIGWFLWGEALARKAVGLPTTGPS